MIEAVETLDLTREIYGYRVFCAQYGQELI